MRIAVPTTIDEYIVLQSVEVREKLEMLRQAIRTSAPKAEEVISYQMPAFKYYGMLVYFAVAKNHIGFYPGPTAVEKFKSELTKYKTSKATIQFPLDKPLPVSLIKKIVKFRVMENEDKEIARKNKRKKK